MGRLGKLADFVAPHIDKAIIISLIVWFSSHSNEDYTKELLAGLMILMRGVVARGDSSGQTKQ